MHFRTRWGDFLFQLQTERGHLSARSPPSGTLFDQPIDPLTLCEQGHEASSEPWSRRPRPRGRVMIWALPLWALASTIFNTYPKTFNSVAPCGHHRVIFSFIFLKWKIIITLLYNDVAEYLYYLYLSFFMIWSCSIQMPVCIHLPKCVITE